MEDIERLQHALQNLIDSEEKRIAQKEKEREEEKQRLKEKAERVRVFSNMILHGSSAITFYVPKESALREKDKPTDK